MPERSLFEPFVVRLERIAIPYFVTGRSEKHLRDIRGMLEVSAGRIDQPFLDAWIARMGVGAEWNQVLAEG